APDGVGRERLAAAGDLRELVDESLGEGDVPRRPGEGDDVAADVDVDAGEPLLDGAEHLVTLTEEGDHRHVVGDGDLMVEHGVRRGRVVAASHGYGRGGPVPPGVGDRCTGSVTTGGRRDFPICRRRLPAAEAG